MKFAFNPKGMLNVVLLVAVGLCGPSFTCGYACGIPDGDLEPSVMQSQCSCCAHCRAIAAPGITSVGAVNCTCSRTSSELPPAFPPDSSRERINPPRTSVHAVSASALPADACMFVDLTANAAWGKPAADHVLGCVWRC